MLYYVREFFPLLSIAEIDTDKVGRYAMGHQIIVRYFVFGFVLKCSHYLLALGSSSNF